MDLYKPVLTGIGIPKQSPIVVVSLHQGDQVVGELHGGGRLEGARLGVEQLDEEQSKKTNHISDQPLTEEYRWETASWVREQADHNLPDTQWEPDLMEPTQLDWQPDNWEPDNWEPDNWQPGQLTPDIADSPRVSISNLLSQLTPEPMDEIPEHFHALPGPNSGPPVPPILEMPLSKASAKAKVNSVKKTKKSQGLIKNKQNKNQGLRVGYEIIDQKFAENISTLVNSSGLKYFQCKLCKVFISLHSQFYHFCCFAFALKSLCISISAFLNIYAHIFLPICLPINLPFYLCLSVPADLSVSVYLCLSQKSISGYLPLSISTCAYLYI